MCTDSPGLCSDWCGCQGLFWLRWKKPNAIRPFKGIPVIASLFHSSSKYIKYSVVAICGLLPCRSGIPYVFDLCSYQACKLTAIIYSPHRAIPQACQRSRRHTSIAILSVCLFISAKILSKPFCSLKLLPRWYLHSPPRNSLLGRLANPAPEGLRLRTCTT